MGYLPLPSYVWVFILLATVATVLRIVFYFQGGYPRKFSNRSGGALVSPCPILFSKHAIDRLLNSIGGKGGMKMED